MASKKKHKMMGTAAGATQRSFTFRADYNPDGVIYVDASRFLSTFNQRLYRQGMNYCLKVDQSIMVATGGATPGSGQYVEVQALPNNWQVRKAWAKAYKMFRKQISEFAGASGANYPGRWHDFKIGYEHGTSWPYAGHPEYNGGNVEPSGAPFAIGDGEYLKSYVTDVATDSRKTCDMFGVEDTGTEYGLLAMYDSLPGVVGPDPAQNAGASGTTADAYQEWITDDDGSHTVIQDLQTQGDEPPYNPDLLQVEAQKMFISANGQQPLSTGWFEAPCGLLKIISRTASAFDSNWITLSVAPGDYKGVMAESMIAKVN